MTLEELLAEFDFLGSWDERCDYLIDLGFELPELPAAAQTEENRVHGCQSNVWLVAQPVSTPPLRLEFLADSDALIVKGLIAVLLTVYSGRTPEEILQTDIEKIFERLGLEKHLSTQRRNGLYGMVQRIRSLAKQYQNG